MSGYPFGGLAFRPLPSPGSRSTLRSRTSYQMTISEVILERLHTFVNVSSRSAVFKFAEDSIDVSVNFYN